MQTENTARQKPRSVPKKKEKLRVLLVKSVFLKIISPSFLALGLVQDNYQSGWQMPGDQEDGYQELWSCVVA